MTASDLARALADCIERCDQLERENAELRVQVAQAAANVAARALTEWLTVQEAAVYLKRTKSYLDKDRIQDVPRIPYRQDGDRGRVLYSKSALDAFVAAGRKGKVIGRA